MNARMIYPTLFVPHQLKAETGHPNNSGAFRLTVLKTKMTFTSEQNKGSHDADSLPIKLKLAAVGTNSSLNTAYYLIQMSSPWRTVKIQLH